jgi:hypothetical protein
MFFAGPSSSFSVVVATTLHGGVVALAPVVAREEVTPWLFPLLFFFFFLSQVDFVTRLEALLRARAPPLLGISHLRARASALGPVLRVLDGDLCEGFLFGFFWFVIGLLSFVFAGQDLRGCLLPCSARLRQIWAEKCPMCCASWKTCERQFCDSKIKKEKQVFVYFREPNQKAQPYFFFRASCTSASSTLSLMNPSSLNSSPSLRDTAGPSLDVRSAYVCCAHTHTKEERSVKQEPKKREQEKWGVYLHLVKVGSEGDVANLAGNVLLLGGQPEGDEGVDQHVGRTGKGQAPEVGRILAGRIELRQRRQRRAEPRQQQPIVLQTRAAHQNQQNMREEEKRRKPAHLQREEMRRREEEEENRRAHLKRERDEQRREEERELT